MLSDSRSEEFAALIVAHQARLYGYILTLLPDANEASDVLQQTNMALWRDAERFTPGTSFVGWSLRTAYFMVLEQRQKVRRQRQRFSDVLMESLAQEAELYVSEDDSRLTAMKNCLEQLPSEQRELIHRRYSNGESVGTMAASKGQAANAVANSLYRIRRSLWSCIQGRLATEGR